MCVCVALTGKNAAARFHLVNGRAAASSRVTSVGGCVGWRLLIIAERHILRAGRDETDEPQVTHFRGGNDRW